jgi:hypothetical protein
MKWTGYSLDPFILIAITVTRIVCFVALGTFSHLLGCFMRTLKLYACVL